MTNPTDNYEENFKNQEKLSHNLFCFVCQLLKTNQSFLHFFEENFP